MARDVSGAVLAELSSDSLVAALLFEIVHPTDSVRTWTGYGPLDAMGRTFLGIGDFGKVSEIQESVDGRINGMTFELSGFEARMNGAALDPAYQNAACTLWLAVFEQSETLTFVGDPVVLFRGIADQFEVLAMGESGVITLQAEQMTRAVRQSRRRTYAAADLRGRHADDAFFDLTPYLLHKNFAWGRPD